MAKANFILPNKPAIKAGSILSYNYTDVSTFVPAPLAFNRNSAATRVNEKGLIEEVISNKPRIDYTDSLTEPSLLLEPQSTNLVTQSETFSNWNTEGGKQVVTQGVVMSPDGTNNGNKLETYDTTYIPHRKLWKDFSVTVGASYTFSVYIKKVDGQLNTGFLHITTGANDLFDVSQAYTATDQWQRVSVTTNSAVSSQIRFLITGDSNSQIYIWGGQVEQLPHPTSYIPATGSTVTRLGETAVNAGDTNVFNSEEGVLYAEISALAEDTGLGTNHKEISISDGTQNNRVSIVLDTRYNRVGFFFANNGVIKSKYYTIGVDIINNNKYALRYKNGELVGYFNGVEVASDSTVTTPFANKLSNLGFIEGRVRNYFHGKTKNIRVFNKALSDEELQKLTTI